MDNNQKIKEIFMKIFEDLKEEDYSEDKKQADFLGWDSFAHMQIVSEVESRFGISFNVDEVTSIESPSDILRILSDKQNA